MPVLLERRLTEGDQGRLAGERRALPGFSGTGSGAIEIGLVNNMPDAALATTETQFLSLLGEASQDMNVRLRLWSAPGVRRGEPGVGHVAKRHLPFQRLWAAGLDGLIITGSEPREADLRAEPYWRDLVELFDWVADSGVPSIYSCLAAHAAMLHHFGVERRGLARKRSGVFEFQTDRRHPMMAGMSAVFTAPHSRWNEIDEAPLRDLGFPILSRSDTAGVNIWARDAAGMNLFFQGHPEYDAETLLLEFRRDVGRYLRGERDDYPDAPANYFGVSANQLLELYKLAAMSQRNVETFARFPTAALAAGLSNAWRAPAVRVLRNWLNYIVENKKSARGETALNAHAKRASRRVAG